ncbi:hypothetical protein K8B66_31775 [Burkholderia contaminans]|nr:aldehyde dehydrogenase family protein [Burkholderia contaminans]UAC75619.1 hypothetical protein K8B66_31775 [Burkholderia contaminans]
MLRPHGRVATRIAPLPAPLAADINYPAWNPAAPFGGYKRSGNGREYAEFGLVEYLETKGTTGYA